MKSAGTNIVCSKAPKARPPGGFTLVELALGVCVLSLVLMTTISSLQRGFAQIDTARNLEIASNIMQCELEKERLFSWTQISNAAYHPTIDSSFTQIPSIAGRFSLSRAIQTLPDRTGKMIKITLTVSWNNYDGRTLSRSFTTYYLQDGLHDYLYNQT